MKKLNLVLASGLLASALTLSPVAASAHALNANSTTAIVVQGDSRIGVWGAQVVSVSGDIIKAVTSVGGTMLNWILNVSADTKVHAVTPSGATATSTAALAAGDRIGFVGSITANTAAGIEVGVQKVREFATSTKGFLHRKDKGDDEDKSGDRGKKGGVHLKVHSDNGLHLGLFNRFWHKE